jgi:diguanylate cyclase
MFRWRRSQDGGAQSAVQLDDRPSPPHGDEPPDPDVSWLGGSDAADLALPTAAGSGVGLADDVVLDAFVQVLRAFGQHAFDLEHENAISFSQECEAWARHLLTLAPPPLETAEDDAPEDDGEAPPPSRRDWPSVLQFLLARRKREQQYVNTALGDLRQSLWTFTHSLGTALVEDQRMDNSFKSQIDRLKVALDRPSTETLKQEVLTTATSLTRLVTERQQTQRRRLEDLGARVSDLGDQLRQAKEANVRDSLTQLVNRKGFDDFMNRMVFMRDVFGETACLLMVDVDHFKSINDRYGHPGGDAVLRALADCMVRSFPRKSDVVARYGGEELAVVLPDTSAQNAMRLAERMLNSIRELRVPHGGHNISLTVSIGVGQLGKVESIQDWLERTDQALYRAKSGGRNRAVEALAAED